MGGPASKSDRVPPLPAWPATPSHSWGSTQCYSVFNYFNKISLKEDKDQSANYEIFPSTKYNALFYEPEATGYERCTIYFIRNTYLSRYTIETDILCKKSLLKKAGQEINRFVLQANIKN